MFYSPTASDWSLAAPFYNNLSIDDQASVRTAALGTGEDARFVVEWRNVLINGTDLRLTFEAVLYPDGRLLFQYGDLPDDPRARGGTSDTWIGISNAYGPDVLLIRGPLDLTPTVVASTTSSTHRPRDRSRRAAVPAVVLDSLPQDRLLSMAGRLGLDSGRWVREHLAHCGADVVNMLTRQSFYCSFRRPSCSRLRGGGPRRGRGR
jgi:hypothetical protein